MKMRRVLGFLAASVVVCAVVAYAQDSQSLGDVARQARLQKQQKDAQAKDASAKDASNKSTPGTDVAPKGAQPPSAPHVITNDDIPSHASSTSTPARGAQTPDTTVPQPDHRNDMASAAQWKFAIQAQKNAIASLQGEIASLSDSIHYAGANCVSNCVQWNERQRQKQDQLESMKSQLEQQQKALEDLQESARKQGFGSAVYDP
jgi:hypothetical protein